MQVKSAMRKKIFPGWARQGAMVEARWTGRETWSGMLGIVGVPEKPR
jgi:hypothetical protein